MTKNEKLYFSPIVQSFLEIKLDAIRHYKGFLISALAREKQELKKRFEKLQQEKNAELIEKYDSFFADERHMENVFKEISINSFVVTLYSFVEYGLNSLCDAEKEDQNAKLRYKDMSERGIERARFYLEKVIELDFSPVEDSWRELKALNIIRNAIVHNDAALNKESIGNATIKAHIKNGSLRTYGSKKGPSYKLIIETDYLDWIVDQAWGFFTDIKV